MDILLRAMVAGYEVSCRIGLAIQPSHYRYWHTTAPSVPRRGGGVGVVLGLDPGRMAHALATAATMAGGLQQAFRGEGMSKPLHPRPCRRSRRAGGAGGLGGCHRGARRAARPVGFAAATSEDTGKWTGRWTGWMTASPSPA
jgi:hypothetical protein